MSTIAKPVLFSAPMVRAILDGRKTMTRRVLKPQPPVFTPHVIDVGGVHQNEDGEWGQIETIWSSPSWDAPMGEPLREEWLPLRLPYAPGMLLWVKEAWRADVLADDVPPRDLGDKALIRYEVDGLLRRRTSFDDLNPGRYRHARFMPRWASRISLRVIADQVERLQDISEADAEAEGVETELWDMCLACRDYGHKDDRWFYTWPGACLDGGYGYTEAEKVRSRSFRSLWESIHGPGSWDANPWVAAIAFDPIKRNIDDVIREMKG